MRPLDAGKGHAVANDDVYEKLHRRFTEMKVPRCTCCGGTDTASVQVGVIGLTIRLAATCRKFQLIPNGPEPGEWFCHGCRSFFRHTGAGLGSGRW